MDGKTTVYDTGVTELVEITDLETREIGKLGYWKDDTLYIEKEKIEGISHTEEVSLCGMCDGVLYYYQDIERSSSITVERYTEEKYVLSEMWMQECR